jgi:nucleotide-binding universal stress UspA family protein
MFQKVLVPVDLTDRHQPALEIAAKLVAPAGGEVLLLHVVEVLQGLPREEEPSFYQRLERKAGIHLNRLLGHLKDRQVTGRAVVLFGERVPEALRYAEQEGVGLIVLTSHPVDPSKPGAGWGTMSYLIGIAARCPVLLVK